MSPGELDAVHALNGENKLDILRIGSIRGDNLPVSAV